MKLTEDFYTRPDVTAIAKELLGKLIVTNIDKKLTVGIISETEAYAGIHDKASHAFNNRRTARTEVMFAKGGLAYVYLCYGVHHLFNVVTNIADQPDAVLLRGIIPHTGIDFMEQRMNKKYINDKFTNGPGKASKALGIQSGNSGESLMGDKIWIEDIGIKLRNSDITEGPRIGVDYAGDDALLPYRYFLNANTIALIIKKAQQIR